MIDIRRESPLATDLALLFARHAEANAADVPAESNHMLGPEGLDQPQIHFFVLREDGVAVGMAAFKCLNADEGEIKSMHVLHEARGKGYSRLLLAHVEAEAARQGLRRLLLETGVQPVFDAAVALYQRFGYQFCPPFADYTHDPNSIFMSRDLAA